MLRKPNHSRLATGALLFTIILAGTLLLSAPAWQQSAVEKLAELQVKHFPAAAALVGGRTPELPSHANDDRLRRHRQSVMDLRDAVMGRLHLLTRDWNAKREYRDGRYELRSLDLDTYAAEMQHVWQSLMTSESERAFPDTSIPLHPILETVLARLSVSSRPVRTPSITKIVWSCAPATTPETPQFGHWRTRNPGYDVRRMDDAGMLTRWTEETFGDAKVVKEFAALPKKILKVDTFRYLAVLMEGGVWADSDTAAVKPVEYWGTGWTDQTDPRLLSHAARRAALWSSFDSSSSDFLPNSPPSLIISTENFSLEGQHKKPEPWWVGAAFARRVQIVNWSFAGPSGHPVLLDAVGRIFERGRMIKEGAKEVEAAGVLDWTGPGLFTDCVLRYLKARWGFDFDTLEDFDHPIRIGDVLILPRNSFQAASSGESQEELDENTPQHVVWHGFAGSWRGDGE